MPTGGAGVIVGGCQDQQQGRGCLHWLTMAGRSIVGGSWFLSSLAAVRISSRGGGCLHWLTMAGRSIVGGRALNVSSRAAGIFHAQHGPRARMGRCSVAAVSRELQRIHFCFGRLAIGITHLKINKLAFWLGWARFGRKTDNEPPKRLFLPKSGERRSVSAKNAIFNQKRW